MNILGWKVFTKMAKTDVFVFIAQILGHGLRNYELRRAGGRRVPKWPEIVVFSRIIYCSCSVGTSPTSHLENWVSDCQGLCGDFGSIGDRKNQRRLKRSQGVKQVLVILSCSNVVCYNYGDPQTSESDCGATKDRVKGKSYQGVWSSERTENLRGENPARGPARYRSSRQPKPV